MTDSEKKAAVSQNIAKRRTFFYSKTSLKVCQRLVYVSGLLILIIIFLVQTYRCLALYISEPTYIATHIVQQRDAEFPAITVCANSGAYKEDVLQAHGLHNKSQYNSQTSSSSMVWASNVSGVSEKQLFELVTLSIDELVKRLYVRFMKADLNGATNYNTYDVAKTNPKWIEEKRHRSFGRCYMLHFPEDIRSLGIYYVRMEFNTDAKLYVHRDNQFYDLTGRMGYRVLKHQRTEAQITYAELIELSREKDGQLTCSDENYFDNCIVKALETHMMTQAGCVVPWLTSDKPICKERAAINTTFWIAWDRITNQLNDCPNPCKSLQINVGGKNLITEDMTNQSLFVGYFSPKITLSEENYFYTELSLLAEIGGYLGLLLGVSIFTFTAWISGLLQQRIDEIEKEEKRKRKADKSARKRSGVRA